MTKTILKTIAAGILTGVTAFFMPKLIIGVFIIMTIGALIFSGRHRRGHHQGYKLAFADKIRSMNDEEYTKFKSEIESGKCCGSSKNNCKQNINS